MKIAIVGFDREGKASLEFLRSENHDITICDLNTELDVPEGVSSNLGEQYLDELDAFDMIIRTPGLHPAQILAKNPTVGHKITSQTNLFFEHCPSKNIIGVTGTKGKGTTSSLIAKMLEADGKHVVLAGNIGVPMISTLAEITTDTWVVLELSNFQLIDLRHSPHIATVLMVEPEHLNWHEDFEEYVAAKQQLFMNQTSDDIAIYFNDNENSISIADASEGRVIPYYAAPGAFVDNETITIDGHKICSVHEITLLGKHNWQNACAAVTTVWQVTQNIEAISSVLTSFKGLEHRLEFVRKYNGISFYDDSFGTTPQTAIVAIQAFSEPKIVIVGGSDKGADFSDLVDTIVENNVKAVIEIGTMGPVIAHKLREKDYTNIVDGGDTMTEIITNATAAAQSGDVVLLSTGCASFGLFTDYKDRGNQFKQVVTSLT